ncbi:sulfite exporter TauE/SafE family protein [Variovorax sp.]|uniref:sulfite exporter TauE/SafE family protein n=1 Tax=Variovorax sp. TaxID=1871043 RepID=UPI002D23FA32|nr:sulfite exporter TauE/SafE family protein [Variovorax sp.]HYP84631.1 sulfite exporter TauE/SafE family protein [Variovorax sp.]
MSVEQLLAISAVVLFAAFVQGSTGVGFALIAAPVIGLVKPELLPVCVLVLMLPLNLYVIWRERSAVDRFGASWITGGRVLGTAGGLWVLTALSATQLAWFVGLSTIAAAVVTLMMPAFSPGRQAFVAAGVITGVTETATGIGGPPLALVYQHQPPATMRSTIALCFLIGQLMSLATLWGTGHIGPAQMKAAGSLLPALVLGALLSRLVHHRINGRFLRIFVQVFAIVSGLVLLVHAS